MLCAGCSRILVTKHRTVKRVNPRRRCSGRRKKEMDAVFAMTPSCPLTLTAESAARKQATALNELITERDTMVKGGRGGVLLNVVGGSCG